MNSYAWLNKKVAKSINTLQLWPENPRLDPELEHLSISDFVEDLTTDQPDEDAFLALVKSIATKGFVPFDPVIVWVETDGKTYVAEGNRRVLAVKLILDPTLAPIAMRSSINRLAGKADLSSLKSLMVNIAPTFEDAEWYINERNAGTSLHRSWSRVQRYRWVLELYTKYNGDMDVISSKTIIPANELRNLIQIIKIRDYVLDPEMRNHMSAEDIALASSIRFPISILERWFSNPLARAHFTLLLDGDRVEFTGDKTRFFKAFAQLIERIIHRKTKYKDSELRIDNRRITSNFLDILESLPNILPEESIENQDKDDERKEASSESEASGQGANESNNDSTPVKKTRQRKSAWKKEDPERPFLVLPIYRIETDNIRIEGLFNEFKLVKLDYKHTLAVALRVFLDLSILELIENRNLASEFIASSSKQSLRNITLSQRISMLYSKKLLSSKANKILNQLGMANAIYSLDVLNGFAHSKSNVHVNKQYLNQFWDYLFPLFYEIHVIREGK